MLIDRSFVKRVILWYAVLGSLWILLSDFLLQWLTPSARILETLQTYKGLTFIVFTTVALYAILRVQSRAVAAERRRALFQTQLLDAVGQAVMATDLAGKITYWNQAAEQIYGWRAEEVIGRDVLEVTPSQAMQNAAERIMMQLRAGKSWQGEFEVQRKDGSSFPALVMDAPIMDDGELVGMIGVSADISDLRQAESALAQSERLHRLILSNISDAVFVTDQAGRFTYICPNVEIIFGHSVDEVEAMGTIDRLVPVDASQLERLGSEGEIQNIPVRIVDGAGSAHDLLVNVKQVDLDGPRVLYTGRDVTERMASQRALTRYTRQLGLQHDLDQLALSGADPGSLAKAALDGLQGLVPCEGSAILEVDAERRTAHPLAVRGDVNPFSDPPGLISLDELWASPQGDLPGGGQIRIDDLAEHDDLPPRFSSLLEAGVRSVMLTRLMASDRIVGSLGLGRFEVEPFTDEEARLVQEVAGTMAIGILSRQLAHEESRRLYELEAVRRASLQLTSELDVHAVLDSIATSVIDLVGSSDVHIFLHRDGELEFGVARWRESERREPYSDPRPEGITANVARNGERVVVDRVSESPLFGEGYADWGGGIAGLPLVTQGRVVGVMNVAYQEPHHFTTAELRILGLLADQAAIAIANADLYESELRQRTELEALLKVGQQLAGRYDQQAVFESIVSSLMQVIAGAEGASLWLYDADVNRLEPVAWQGYEDSLFSQLSIDPATSLVGEVFSQERSILFHHALRHPSFVRLNDEMLDRVQSVFGAPIRGTERVIGALFVDSFTDPEAFGEHDRQLLEGLAAQAATALERASLFDQVVTSRQHLQTLSRQLVQAQEDERRRIARELHDEIGQLLTGAKLTLEMSIGSEADLEDQQRGVHEALNLIKDLLARVRDLSLDLRPSMLDDLGLLPALTWHLDRYQSTTGIKVDFEQSGIEGARYPSELETTAYRVIQESLTNIARHAQVKLASVRVWVVADMLVIEVQDQGVGFSYEQALEIASASGLSGMRERVQLLGGRFEIETEPGRGTRLRADIPLEGFVERRHGKRGAAS